MSACTKGRKPIRVLSAESVSSGDQHCFTIREDTKVGVLTAGPMLCFDNVIFNEGEECGF